MPDLNEHMDELMRKASEEYPLRIAGQDWQKVEAQLKPEKDRRRPWFWLFLPAAIGLAFVAWYFVQQNNTPDSNKPIAENSIESANSADISLPVTKAAVHDKIKAQEEPDKTNSSSPAITGNPSSEWNNRQDKSVKNTGYGGKLVNNRSKSKAKVEMKLTGAGFELSEEEKNNPAVSLVTSGKEMNIDSRNIQNEVEEEANKNTSEAETNAFYVKNDMPVVIKYIPVAENGTEEKNEKKKARFYAGISGGLDVSSVKLQGFDRTGKNFGLIAGIELNDHWAIEAGVSMNRKYYSTDGKYFKGSYPLPYYATIESATGDCDMLDFPVTARYTINPGKKFLYTVNAGFSSYLMQEESYTYQVNHNGNRYPKDMEYYNSEFTPLAVITAGAGVAFDLGKFRLGAEPYFRLPLQKMGTGKLPLQSAGLNLRLIRKF